MSFSARSSNRLLSQLSEDDFQLLRPHLVRVPLELHQSLAKAHSQTEHAYFPEKGIVSLVAHTSRKSNETGLVGWDGVTGMGLVLGDDRGPFDAAVQLAGHGFRISRDHFLEALGRSATLRSILSRYARALWIQAAYTATAASYRLEARLARWLLMIHDRVEGDSFEVTHEFLATMLAVRRPGVTVALHELEYKGLIKSTRGCVQILDRPGLIEHADGVYSLPETEYERLIGAALMRESENIPLQ